MEMMDIVDEADQVVGQASKQEVYANKLRHRIVHVMVFNAAGEVLLQRRSVSRSYMPGCWVTSAGGHVDAGESYKQAAARELEEEVGIESVLTEVGRYFYCEVDGQNIPKHLAVYRTEHEGPFVPDQGEVSELSFVPLGDVSRFLSDPDLVHPELAFVLDKCFGITLGKKV